MNTAANSKNDLYESPVPEVKPKPVIETGTRFNNSDSFELIEGDAVIALLYNDSGFRQSWDLLFESCPWATVFQSRAFVTAWYQAYREEHCPLLVKAVENGQLKGVLPLAILNTPADDRGAHTQSGRITAAGHYEALYQTWLVAPSDGDAFIKKALTELMKQFPGCYISLRFLPPGTPMKWTTDDRKWRKHSIIQSHSCPLIHLSGVGSERIFQHKKHFKHKLNRLKRLGDVRFDTITDQQQFEKSLQEMSVLFDFRQSALFNKSPFREDPAKKEFLLELFRLHLLHVTALKVDEKIIAAVVAVGEKDWMYLAGINCHCPGHARSFSPGFLHFVLLSQQLAAEGFQYFDLSPGYDPYKEELANQHEDVYELLISSKPSFRIKRRIKKWIHTRLIAAGKRPMSVELSIKYYAYLAKHRSPASIIKSLFKRFQKKEKQQHYLLQQYTAQAPTEIKLNKDNLIDLQEFTTGKRSNLTQWEFLSNAAFRLERGQHCYTWVEEGCLLACAWFSWQDAQSAKKDDNPEAGNRIEIHGLYYHATGKDRLTVFLNAVIETAVNKEGKNYFVTSEPLFCKALELAGGQQQQAAFSV
jgi:CelD/BcsL family acetyltransferase involved in cellulose biosynthesis